MEVDVDATDREVEVVTGVGIEELVKDLTLLIILEDFDVVLVVVGLVVVECVEVWVEVGVVVCVDVAVVEWVDECDVVLGFGLTGAGGATGAALKRFWITW